MDEPEVKLSPEQEQHYIDIGGQATIEAKFLKEHPNAKIIARYSDQGVEDQAYSVEDLSYSVDLVIDDTVISIFNKEWALANEERDFGNRVRRALSKVVEYWEDPEPKAEVDIVVYKEDGREVIGKGQLLITDEGLEIVGHIDDKKTVSYIDENTVTDLSIYGYAPFPELIPGDHVTHKLYDGTSVVKIYRGRVWNTETQSYVIEFEDLADGE